MTVISSNLIAHNNFTALNFVLNVSFSCFHGTKSWKISRSLPISITVAHLFHKEAVLKSKFSHTILPECGIIEICRLPRFETLLTNKIRLFLYVAFVEEVVSNANSLPEADPGFSLGGDGNSQSRCANLLFCKFFAENCMNMKEF